MLRVGYVTFYSTFLFSALFYKKFTPSTARTKLSAGPAADGDAASVNAQMLPFLTCGWLIHHRILLSIAQFSPVMLECGTESGDEVTLVRRPMDRGHELFYCGYVHDVSVSTVDGEAFIIRHNHSSQHKNTKYIQKLVVRGRRLAFTSYGRVAGMDGGLCAHVFADLKVLSDGCRNQGPATNSICIASMPCSWGNSKQDVEPKPVMDIIVDQSMMVKKGPPISYNLHDSRTRELHGVEKRGIASLDMPFPVSCIRKGYSCRIPSVCPTCIA